MSKSLRKNIIGDNRVVKLVSPKFYIRVTYQVKLNMLLHNVLNQVVHNVLNQVVVQNQERS